ncbi:MAG: SHOCT domain-containing protein [Actinobacteria bacterium]|nr:SHOCT domain-containing protein [Actinomycetota bacterium]
MSSQDDLIRAVKEIGQEFGRIAEQAGAFMKDSAQQFAGKLPFGTSKSEDAPADPIEAIRSLGGLRDAGLLTDEEFQAKKRELLERI